MPNEAPKQILTRQQFGPGEGEAIQAVLGEAINVLCSIVPKLAPHLLSGGTVEIKTMSGMTVRFGFNPQQGGIIDPSGIMPVNPRPFRG